MNHDATRLAEQVMQRCDRLAELSEEPDRLTRRYLCPPMRDVHQVLQSWMHAANMQFRVDHAGNCIGRSRCDCSDKVLLLGSHLDTVPGAGRYDGALGVLIGLAVAQRLKDQPLPFHLDVVGLSEEEGVRFCMPYLGSAAIAGSFRSEWLDRTDDAGMTMRQAIERFNLDPNRIPDCAYRQEQVIAYIEPHLEQGPVLDQRESPVGVVTCIAGQSRLRVAFLGEAGHAGATPMNGRRDALVAASRFVQQVNHAAKNTEGLRATVGALQAVPNTSNVIPGRVELSLDVRHADNAARRRAIDDLMITANACAEQEQCGFALLEENSQDAAAMDPDLAGALLDTLAECGCDPFQLESGAGHDAVVMSHAFPIAMLFVRHPGGVSHCPDERVRTEDVAVAIEVLSRYVLRLACTHASPLEREIA